jgi:hypothetical protein
MKITTKQLHWNPNTMAIFGSIQSQPWPAYENHVTVTTDMVHMYSSEFGDRWFSWKEGTKPSQWLSNQMPLKNSNVLPKLSGKTMEAGWTTGHSANEWVFWPTKSIIRTIQLFRAAKIRWLQAYRKHSTKWQTVAKTESKTTGQGME